MFAVIFEVQPKTERLDDYLDLAKQLKPEARGDRRLHRQRALREQARPGRLLSLSTWRDEKAVIRWRTHGEHHGVQEKGRFEVFEDYHLRVGEIIADTAPPKAPPSRAALRRNRDRRGQARHHHGVAPREKSTLGAEGSMSSWPISVSRRHGRPHRPGAIREHLQSRQAVAARRLAGCRGRNAWTPNETRRCRVTAPPPRSHHPRLRDVRSPRGAAVHPT